MCSSASCYSMFIFIATLMGVDLFLEQSGSGKSTWCWLSIHAQWFPISLTSSPSLMTSQMYAVQLLISNALQLSGDGVW